jgi:tRNA(adenine34) deaminase
MTLKQMIFPVKGPLARAVVKHSCYNTGMETHEYFMTAALQMAKKAAKKDEVPVGAVIVYNGAVIAKAHNLRETKRSPLAHAEIIAIEKAARRLGGWRLTGCTLYVTLEPCPMCAGAIVNSRIDEVVFGAYDPKAGACGTLYNLAEGRLNHTPIVTGGVMEPECADILKEYFKSKRTAEKNGVPVR